VLLACSRVAGETAPLLFTTSGNQFWSRRLSDPIASLPRQIYTFAIGPYDDQHRQAWAGALILILLVLSINIGVRIITREGSAKPVK
jgi:phosphate transport system permease protein